MGILALDETDRVIEWQEKPKQPKSDLASMGVYVFSKKALRRWLSRGPRRLRRATSSRRCSMPAPASSAIATCGYWQDVGTIQSYWEANMALLDDDPELDLYDKDWVIHTRSEERAPGQGRADRPGPPQPDQPRLRHRRHGRELGAVAGRAGRRRRGRARFDRHVRLGHPLGRGRRPRDPRQGGRRRPGRDRRRRAVRRPARTSRSRAASTPASPSSASGRSSRAARGIGRNVKVAADVRIVRLRRRRSSRAANRSSRSPAPRSRPTATAAAAASARRLGRAAPRRKGAARPD